MLGNDDIKNIIDDCLEKNKVVSTKDIAYVILCLNLEDSVVAYKCVFGSENYDSDMHDSYDACDTMQYLKEYIPYCIERANKRNDSHETQIDYSFDDNKAYMLKLKQSDRRGFSARSTGALDTKSLPTRSFKSKSHLERISSSCIRFNSLNLYVVIHSTNSMNCWEVLKDNQQPIPFSR